jgi:hypothetical protein
MNRLAPTSAARPIDAERLAVEPDHVQDLDCVRGVLLRGQLDEAVPLMRACDAILGHVHGDDGPGLREELPDERLRGVFVNVADKDSGVGIAVCRPRGEEV